METRAILDANAAMMNAKWEAAVAVAAAAKAAPPVTRVEPLASPLPFPPTIPERQLRSPGDMLMASPEHILEPDTKAFVLWLQPLLRNYAELVAPGATTTIKPSVLEEDFARIAGIKYALMVRVREMTPSKVIAETVGDTVELRYRPGTITGDAIFYELASKQRLGAFPFSFEAKGDFQTKSNASDDEQQERLERHLRDSVERQLVEAVGTFATRS